MVPLLKKQMVCVNNVISVKSIYEYLQCLVRYLYEPVGTLLCAFTHLFVINSTFVETKGTQKAPGILHLVSTLPNIFKKENPTV